jgi:hypothetical protein
MGGERQAFRAKRTTSVVAENELMQCMEAESHLQNGVKSVSRVAKSKPPASNPQDQQHKHKPTAAQHPGHPAPAPPLNNREGQGEVYGHEFGRSCKVGTQGKAQGEHPTPPTPTNQQATKPDHNHGATPEQFPGMPANQKRIAAREGAFRADCEGRSSAPVRLEAEPTVRGIDNKKGLLPRQHRRKAVRASRC